jgi:hypothetical protein
MAAVKLARLAQLGTRARGEKYRDGHAQTFPRFDADNQFIGVLVFIVLFAANRVAIFYFMEH